jgi:hypothetical protein
MHPGSVPWVVLSLVLLCGLCALTYAADQTITRTVEDFTLGMPQDQALTRFIAGIKHHTLTLVDQPQTDTQALMEFFQHHSMDTVEKQWVAPQSADVLYTINALLFDAPEFNDPVVNSTLAAQVAQSLAWSSPTAVSMYLVLYQSKVLGIFVLPLASYATMKKDCLTKYGPAQESIYHKSYGFAFVQGDQWSDTHTSLTLTVDNGLFYVDRALYALLKEEAAGLLKPLP